MKRPVTILAACLLALGSLLSWAPTAAADHFDSCSDSMLLAKTGTRLSCLVDGCFQCTYTATVEIAGIGLVAATLDGASCLGVNSCQASNTFTKTSTFAMECSSRANGVEAEALLVTMNCKLEAA